MLYIIGLIAAFGYMYLKGNAIDTHISAQVAEYHAQEKQARHDEPPDATYKEIRSSWKHGSKTGHEEMRHSMTSQEKKALLAAQAELHDEAKLYDSVGACAHVEVEGVILEMANRH
jgi:hypothetical protein